MDTITQSQLADLLKQTRGTTAISLYAMTDAKARKTGNPYGIVQKALSINGMIGYDYHRAATKADEMHVAKPRAWGERDGCLVHHQGKTYVSLLVRRVLTSPLYYVQRDGMTVSVPASAVCDLLPMRRPETYPVVRDYCLDNVRVVRFNGKKMRVIPG